MAAIEWDKKKILITGGASFIGSHLTDALLSRAASVRVVDDLTSGFRKNIESHLLKKEVEFIDADLREPGIARQALKGIDLVFHLAADHGGRGYVDTFQAGPASNLFLDGLIFWESVKASVEKVVYASSGCVYPNYMQQDLSNILFLTEDKVKAPYDADNMYGWAKLMAELTLQAYYKEHGLKAVSLRFFTVYGPRAKEDHAVIAMIAKAFIDQNPVEIWGSGEQIRNWTYIDDIVSGVMAAAEKVDDGTAINLGTMERIKVADAMKLVLQIMGKNLPIRINPDMPSGPLNRVADNSLAKRLLDWEPQVLFKEGLQRTIDWYTSTKNPEEVRRILSDGGLIKRKMSSAVENIPSSRS